MLLLVSDIQEFRTKHVCRPISEYSKFINNFDIRSIAPITMHLNPDPKLMEQFKVPAILQEPPDRDDVWIHLEVFPSEQEQIDKLLQDYIDVIIPDDIMIPMGQMRVKHFEIHLVDGGTQELQKIRPKPFPARGPKQELLNKSFQELESNGGGRNNEEGVVFASPCYFLQVFKVLLFCLTEDNNVINKD